MNSQNGLKNVASKNFSLSKSLKLIQKKIQKSDELIFLPFFYHDYKKIRLLRI